MKPEIRAALAPAERQAVAVLSAIYVTRMLGLFLLLPVLALYAGALPGGTPLLAGLAVGAYGLSQALLQIPFGSWSDRLGRKPLIVAGLGLYVAGSALGVVAGTAWGIIGARFVQGCGAVSGPVMALLADLTRPASRTRAMAIIGASIGASFIVSLVAGPALAGLVGVSGLFALMGLLGLVAIALVLWALPAEPQARDRNRAPRPWRAAGSRELWPLYGGVLMLHLSLTSVFIAVPHVLQDLHGLPASQHWSSYLGAFVLSLLLTIPLVLWSERGDRPRRPLLAGALLLALAQLALAFFHAVPVALAAALVGYFGAFNFLEASLPARLSGAAGEAVRGAALGLFATCQFIGAFAGGLLGGVLLGSPLGLTGVFLVAAFASGCWALWLAAGPARGGVPG